MINLLVFVVTVATLSFMGVKVLREYKEKLLQRKLDKEEIKALIKLNISVNVTSLVLALVTMTILSPLGFIACYSVAYFVMYGIKVVPQMVKLGVQVFVIEKQPIRNVLGVGAKTKN